MQVTEASEGTEDSDARRLRQKVAKRKLHRPKARKLRIRRETGEMRPESFVRACFSEPLLSVRNVSYTGRTRSITTRLGQGLSEFACSPRCV
eukprot:5435503-Prymnesium_polylepis.1